jgi:hypothetical protein
MKKLIEDQEKGIDQQPIAVQNQPPEVQSMYLIVLLF